MLTCRNYSVGPNDHCLLCADQVNEDILHLFSIVLSLLPAGSCLA
jgi:hypothetical protein